MRHFYYLLFILLQTYYGYSQSNNPQLTEIFQDAISKISYNPNTNLLYTDSIMYNGFNFLKFNNQDITNDSNTYFMGYYDNKNLMRLIKFTNSKKLLQFDFYYSKDVTYYTSYIYDSTKWEYCRGYFAPGFFVRKQEYSINYFFSFNHKFIQEARLLNDYSQESTLKLEPEIGIESIDLIYKLDKDLKIVSKLNYYENELLFYSDFFNQNEKTYEVVNVYAKNTCGETSLDKINLYNLNFLLNNRMCEDGVKFLVNPIIDEKTPLWSKINYNYQTILE